MCVYGVQQLSCKSSVLGLTNLLPRRVRPHHGVQDREQLAHAGDERDLLRLAGRDESTIEGANDDVASSGDKRPHVEYGADRRAAAPDHAFASTCAAVAGERRHAHERRDLFAIESPQLGKVRQQGATQDGTDAWCGAEQMFFRPPDRAPLDGVIEITIDVDAADDVDFDDITAIRELVAELRPAELAG